MKTRRIHKILTICLIIVLSTGLLCSCGNGKSEIKGVIGDFEKACNKVDLNKMLDCLDPKISGPIEMVTGFASVFTDKSSEDLLDSLADLLIDDNTLDVDSFFSTVKFTVKDVAINENIAIAYASVKYGKGDNITEKDASFECIYTDEKWYISDFNFQ